MAADYGHLDPMLIGATSEPFDDPDYIYELKLDGERCIAILDPEEGTQLRNKRHVLMLPKVPELADLHRQVKAPCVLDGELIVIRDGRPDFFAIQRRSLMSNRFRIELAAKHYPACFTAFDLLFERGEALAHRPLMERKARLEQVVAAENERFALSRYVEGNGIAFFELAKARDLEGIVAKRRGSIYRFGERTKDWIKIKHMLDDDYVVCGYIFKENHMISLVLGQFDAGGRLLYRGHVMLGVSGAPFREIAAHPRAQGPPFDPPAGNEEAIWLVPDLVCTVQYMMRTPEGGIRHPVFKGLRRDKVPRDCVLPPEDEAKP